MEMENLRACDGRGRLEVVCGPMYSGKSEELIRRLRRAQIAKLIVMSFKPVIDDRYDALSIASHSNQAIATTPVSTVMEMELIIQEAAAKGLQPDVVGIDEVQFLDASVSDYAITLVELGVRVIVAGLDMDYKGAPFGQMPTLLALADKVLKLSAVCTNCGAPATCTHRLTKSTEVVQVGANGMYEARCRACWNRGDV